MWSWLANPWMLGLGTAAVSLPILIHLLNKRRFKIVDWAAMDFLFDAEKKNRRRVRMENFLLLLLRCLAMLLLGLLLARPFLPSGLARVLAQKQQFERVILIDDSLSQNVLRDRQPALEVARESIVELMNQWTGQAETDDWLTVLRTSDPGNPVLVNEPLTRSTLGPLVQVIEGLTTSDAPVDYGVALAELKRYLSGTREKVNRVAYLYSDLRSRDWGGETEAAATAAALADISERAVGCFVVDVGGTRDDNLAITSIRPEDLQVADKVIRFNVEVTNFGRQTVNNLRVLLQVNDEPPEYAEVPSLAPGQTEPVAFRYYFNPPPETRLLDSDESIPTLPFQNFRLTASLDRQAMTAEELGQDQLIDDSSAFYAARILNRIPVLLVDGDPSSVAERSETHYLNSLGVLGTGLDMETVTATDFETVSLSRYRVIFLCNVDEASRERIRTLEQWVAEGGALVIMPGNRVQASIFNDVFYRDGEGLSPLALRSMEGDPTMSRWVNFEIDPQSHPALELIVSADAASLGNVDVFSWWTSDYDEQELGRSFMVPLWLNDPDRSIAMADRPRGRGRVVVFTLPADGDWSMWPSSVTFVPVMIDLIDYLVGIDPADSSVPVGGVIRYPLDLSVYQNRAALLLPESERVEAVARPIGDEADAEVSELYEVEFDPLQRRGFHELQLQRHDGTVETVLYAANVDPGEGNLRRVEQAEFESGVLGDGIRLVSVEELVGQEVRGGELEIWPFVLLLLFAILVLEQFLGWYFGRKRRAG